MAFAAPYPGKILYSPLEKSAALCQCDAFLHAGGNVDINVAFTKRIGAGFSGGEAFILQRLDGTDEVFTHNGGTSTSGWSLRSRPPSFGGEGLFSATVTGPGRI